MGAFFAQGGYAFYVWSTYGMALILLVLELVQLGRRHRVTLIHLARLLKARALRARASGGSPVARE